MKLRDTCPGQMYETTIEHSPDEKTTLLILITDKPGRFNPVDYEFLASSDHLFYALDYDEEMTPVPDSNLPLFVGYPLKTDKFYDLLKDAL